MGWDLLSLLLLLLPLLLRRGLGLDNLDVGVDWLGHGCWSDDDLTGGCDRWGVDWDLFSLSSGLLNNG